MIDLDQEIRWPRNSDYDEADIWLRMNHNDSLKVVGSEQDGYQWFIYLKDVNTGAL